jgi:hypothetical protein
MPAKMLSASYGRTNGQNIEWLSHLQPLEGLKNCWKFQGKILKHIGEIDKNMFEIDIS